MLIVELLLASKTTVMKLDVPIANFIRNLQILSRFIDWCIKFSLQDINFPINMIEIFEFEIWLKIQECVIIKPDSAVQIVAQGFILINQRMKHSRNAVRIMSRIRC